MKTLGFERLAFVQDALLAIHGHITASELRSNWSTYVQADTQQNRLDDILHVQKIAKSVAQHYRITDTTFVVSFNSALEAAARVEVRNAREIFIEYNHTGEMHAAELLAIMAHEIAHIYLHRLGISFSDTLKNEVLTDTAAIYLGFGSYFLSAQREQLRQYTDQKIQTVAKSIGYISSEEMGYILAQRDYLRNENSGLKITSNIGLDGYRKGKARFILEQQQRPYVRRGMLDRWCQRVKWGSVKRDEKIVFPCLICKQSIRMPALYKTVNVTWRTDIPVSVLQSLAVTHAAFRLENGNEVRVPMLDLRRVLKNSPTRFAGRIVGPFNVDPYRSTINGMAVGMTVQER